MTQFEKLMGDAAFYTDCGNRLFGRRGAAKRAMTLWYAKADQARMEAIGFASI